MTNSFGCPHFSHFTWKDDSSRQDQCVGSAAPSRPRRQPLSVPAGRAGSLATRRAPRQPARGCPPALRSRRRATRGPGSERGRSPPPPRGPLLAPLRGPPGSPSTLPRAVAALGGPPQGSRTGVGVGCEVGGRSRVPVPGCPPLPALPRRCEDTLRSAPASDVRGSGFRRPGRSRVRVQPGGLLPASAASPAAVRAGEGAHAGPRGGPGEPTL